MHRGQSEKYAYKEKTRKERTNLRKSRRITGGLFAKLSSYDTFKKRQHLTNLSKVVYMMANIDFDNYEENGPEVEPEPGWYERFAHKLVGGNLGVSPVPYIRLLDKFVSPMPLSPKTPKP